MVDLKSLRVKVHLEQANTDDLLEIVVVTDNRDRVQWDVTRERKGWPKSDAAPTLWMTFLAWTACRRADGPVPDSFDAFNRVCVYIEPVDAAGNALTKEEILNPGVDEDEGEGFPTRRDPVTASSSS